jgi:hypothetical protein
VNVDTGQFQAITGELAELRADVAEMRSVLSAMDRASVILARAAVPDRAPRPADQRHARPRHLKAIPQTGGTS